MKDKICATLTENHVLNCSCVAIGRTGENECTQLEITLDECLCDKWLYLDFIKPDGTKFKTPKLEIVNNKTVYDIPNSLLDEEGYLQVQVVLQKEDGEIWKSNIKTYVVNKSINATDDIPEKEDFINHAQGLLEEIEEGLTPTIGDNGNWFVGDHDTGKPARGETGLTPNIKIGEVKTLETGSEATVTRSGTDEDPVFSFGIPRGDDYVFTEEDKKEIVDIITEDANSVFNQNASKKTEAYNNNAQSKLTEFNTNSSNKTTAFNTNAGTKTTEYNTNATNKLNSYNSNAEASLKAYNNNSTEKSKEYNENATAKVEEYNSNANEVINKSGHIENKLSGFDVETETTNFQPEQHKFIENNLSLVTLNNFYAYVFDVNPFDTYKLDICSNAVNYGSSTLIIALVNDNTIIKKYTKNDLIFENNRVNLTLNIPYNVNKVYINTDGARNYIAKINNYIVNNIKKEQLDEKLQTIFNDNYENVEPTLLLNNGYMDANGYLNKINNYQTYKYNVKPNEKYKITVKQIYANPIVLFSFENNNRTQTVDDVTYDLKRIFSTIKSNEQEYNFVDYEFTIPEYCKEIYINVNTNHHLILKKVNSYTVKLEDLDIEQIKNQLNPLNEKTIMFVGDSICIASTAGVKGWWRLIQENNPTAIVYNYGKDGATIAENGKNDNVISRKIETMYSEHPEADYIIIEGGVNDLWQQLPLGTFEENGNFNAYTPYDKTTFSGALEYIFHYALTHFKGKKIGYIVTHKIHQAGGFENYMEQARKICKKWSIPYIDLFNEGCMNYLIEQQRQDFSITNVVATGDGCHPNLEGYKIITPKIENWLKRL